MPDAARAEDATTGTAEAGPGGTIHRCDSGGRPQGTTQAASHRHRICTRLRKEKPEIEVGEATVREYVNLREQAMGLLGREIFVPQSYQFGGEAQVDWYKAWADFHPGSEDLSPGTPKFDGQRRKV
jgi:hypothetical protein